MLYYYTDVYQISINTETMGWKTISGRRYFYETIEADGRRLQKCWGSGEEAEQAAARIAAQKEKTTQSKANIRQIKKQDSMVEELTSSEKIDLKNKLNNRVWLANYSKQNAKLSSFENRTYTDPQTGEVHMDRDLAMKLEDDVRQVTLNSLKKAAANNPEEAAKVDQLIDEVHIRVAEMREEYSHAMSTAIESLLIEQIITAWVQWFVANRQLEAEPITAANWRQYQYLERRYQRCQTKLARTVEQLARIRSIRRPFLESGRE